MIGIYKITSPTNRIYIGQSINIEKRFKDYINLKNCKNQIKLYNSFLKYGVENHKFEIVEECNIDLLNNKERYYQDLFCVITKNGLNCILTNSDSKTKVFSEETRNKISNSNKGKKIGVLNPFYGKKHNKETGIKIGLANSRRIISEETRKKISLAGKNKTQTQDAKNKISLANKGRKKSKEEIEIRSQKRRKIIIDLYTGIFYFGSKEIALLLSMKESNIYYYLKTNERYKITN
jgi:group I intron endonuclease